MCDEREVRATLRDNVTNHDRTLAQRSRVDGAYKSAHKHPTVTCRQRFIFEQARTAAPKLCFWIFSTKVVAGMVEH